MASIAAVMFLIVCGINIANYYNVSRSADDLLAIIADNQGIFPADSHDPGSSFSGKHHPSRKNIPAEAAYNTRYFTVTLYEDGTVYTINTGKIHASTPSDAKDYATELYASGKTSGFLDNYKYLRISLPNESEESPEALPQDPSDTAAEESGESDSERKQLYMYIFLDCEQDLITFHNFFLASIGISVAGLLLVFLLVVLFSGKALKPVAESYAKQKHFITDASHELKTPLTIIEANTEILEMMSEENEWTQSIHNQIRRLTELTEKMVFLTRMDEEHTKLTMMDFSLSDAVTETVEPFLAVAETQNLTLSLLVEPNVSYHGDEATIRQLISLLVDNAIKYASRPGEIQVKLHTSGRSRHLSVWNTVDDIEPGSHDLLFDRFYRRDTSRNTKTGGHGIGLSVAQAIVLAHKGKISAKSTDGKSLLFSITLT